MARYLSGRLLSVVVVAAGVLLGAFLAGCAGQDIGVFKPFAAVLRMKEPVRIGVTRLQLNPVEAPWDGFVAALGKTLNRPVQVISYRPFQIRSQLNRGYLDLAILSATDYAEIGGQSCVLLAKPVNILGQTSRHGLIIVKKDSKVQAVADLKGRRFAFGPAGDAASDVAAAYALMKAGLQPGDIPRELLPIPLTRRHHMNSFEVGKAVAYEPLLDAGAVDQVAYSGWPEKGPSPLVSATPIPMVLQSVTRDRFRVLAETPTLPEGPIVASRKADPKLVAAVRDCLLAGAIPAKALKPMEWRGFVAVDAGEYDQAIGMVQQLREGGWIHEDVPETPAIVPAPASEPTATPASAPVATK